MVSSLRPFLVNDLFGDPALYVRLPWERRALLFDLGDIGSLSAGRLLKITDVFVSHAHVDHFIGFDHLLRVLLGRPLDLRLYGPPGFIDRVEGKLRGYSWNLVDGYSLSIEVREVHPDRVRSARFTCPSGFRREDGAEAPVQDGPILDEPEFRVRCAHLDHRIPCLAFALEESVHLNVDKARLDHLGLPVGQWLMDAKRAIRSGKPDDTPIRVAWSAADGRHDRSVSLGVLRREVVRESPGQKLVYVTDAIDSEENRKRILTLAEGADVLLRGRVSGAGCGACPDEIPSLDGAGRSSRGRGGRAPFGGLSPLSEVPRLRRGVGGGGHGRVYGRVRFPTDSAFAGGPCRRKTHTTWRKCGVGSTLTPPRRSVSLPETRRAGRVGLYIRALLHYTTGETEGVGQRRAIRSPR